MPPAPDIRRPSRKDPVVRRIVVSWRRLTGGRGVRDEARATLVACSGGADSSALLLALATVAHRARIAVAHIVHDMRPEDEARRDQELTADLCARLGLTLHVGRVGVASQPGNTEANARRARYAELAAIARRSGYGHVATGHHADDQLETVLMRLMRGSGAKGLSGIHPVRPLDGCALIRPMLEVTHADAEGLCRRCGWVWAEDRTNADLSRRRAALRRRVLPALREIEPRAALHAVRLAEAVGSAHDVVVARASALESGAERNGKTIFFSRIMLRNEEPAVLVELILRLHHSKTGGARRDRIDRYSLNTCIGGISDQSGEERCFELGGLSVRVDSKHVSFS